MDSLVKKTQLKWVQEVWACPLYYGIVHGNNKLCRDQAHAGLRHLVLFAIIKLRTLQSSVMGS